jgi:xylono-1,5-lactonase
LADVLASGFGLAEAPTVEPGGALLFSDVLGGGVHRLDGSSVTTLVPKRRGVGGIALHADGGVVVSGRAIVHVRDGETRTILDVEGVAGWNDLCTDSAGRVYAGALRFAVFDPSATPVPGELWRIDTDGTATVLYGDVIHANGVGLSPDERTIYHSDSRANQVIVHDLTEDGAAIRRRAIDTAPYGSPDGLVVDERGYIWVAIIGSVGLACFTPDGELDTTLDLPSTLVTSLCFGGDDGRDLFVTTGNHADTALKGCVLHTRAPIAGARPPAARV